MAPPELRSTRRELPSFVLPDRNGTIVRAWSYRQRRQLVVLLSRTGAPATAAARELAKLVPDLNALEAEVLVVHSDAVDSVADWYADELGLRQVNEVGGHLAADLGLAEALPAVIVVNRYGVIHAVLRAESAEVAYHALEWMQFLSIQCSE